MESDSARGPVDLDAVLKEVDLLRRQNTDLTDLVNAKGLSQGRKLSICGYLNKYSERPGSWLAGLLNKEWNMRFFCLYGSTLQYYLTEQDMMGHPRGHIDLQGARVEVEGRKRGQFWTFNVVQEDSRGCTISLVRCSTESHNTFQKWLTALRAVGCNIVEAPERAEPPATADVRYGDGIRRSASAQSMASSDTGGPSLDRSTPPSSLRQRVPSDARPYHSGYTSQSEVSDAGRSSHRQNGAHTPGGPAEGRGATSLVHKICQPSALSSERIKDDFEGLRNLIMVLFAATTIRMMLENYLKYGIRLNPKNWVLAVVTPEAAPQMFLLWLVVFTCIPEAWAVNCFAEKLRKQEEQAARPSTRKVISPAQARRNAERLVRWHESLITVLHVITFGLQFLVPVYCVYKDKEVPVVPGFILVMVTSIVSLKLVSYAHCNHALRNARRKGEVVAGERGSATPIFDHTGEAVRYPESLALNNLVYFLAAPTLVYQVAYPRSTRFRIRWLLKRVAELVMVSFFGLIVTEQYVTPAIVNSYGAFDELRYLQAIERLLKLSVPTLWGWLVVFYSLFHLLLNIVAELTRFGDREFYRAWWNAASIGEYWTLWNIPVHNWMHRHVYQPIRTRTSRNVGILACFLVSAIFHEIMVAVPLHCVKGYAFAGMLGQVPMVFITEWLKLKLKKPFVGNVIFWVTFCIIGQPLCIMMYYHDYKHGVVGPSV
ncbi:hypothetical protein ABBQ38_004622 [Trebouxia sp. C0009 RCD-2024]